MAFQQGLSGLNASSKSLDVISNNISNASTVGFKGGQAQFADVFAAASSGTQVGIGSSLSSVAQQFTQGNISNTNNPLDLAINGNGFFRLQKSLTDSTISFTRNGQYHLDASGYVINAQKNNLTGYPVTNGVTNRSTMVPVQLNTQGIPPIATGTSTVNAGVQLQINLDDRELKSYGSASPNNLAAWSGNTAFPPNNLNTFNYSTSLQIYDQKGNSHTLAMYFTRIDPATSANNTKNMFDMHFVLDTTDITPYVKGATNGGGIGVVPTVQFAPGGGIIKSGFAVPATANDPDGVARSVDYQFNIDTSAATGIGSLATFSNLFPPTSSGVAAIPVDLNNSTMFGAPYDVNKLTQDGYQYGRLTGVSVSPNGVLQGNYSNGQSKSIVQLVLADFVSPTGLLSLGNNQWAESAASGQPLIGEPGAGSRGLLQSAAVEDANVDLTQELVNLITAQRNYQANAQSIKTQDQVMQTLVNMR